MDSQRNTNKSLQEDEIQAMFAIYESEWQLENPDTNDSFSIKLTNSSGNSIFFKVVLPEDYPLISPPRYLISAPWMSKEIKDRLTAVLEDTYAENIGNCVLYEWVIKIQEFIDGDLSTNVTCEESQSVCNSEDSQNVCNSEEDIPNEIPLDYTCELFENFHLSNSEEDNFEEELPLITHGEVIEDRKSVFQGHVAKVVSVDQVNKVLSKLKEYRKVAIATHNIFAYRISTSPNSVIQDCDDDGESRAGSTLLRLLQQLDLKNVVVIVSRWFGGILLGQDRYKDIKYAARKALLAGSFIQEVGKPKCVKRSTKKTRNLG